VQVGVARLDARVDDRDVDVHALVGAVDQRRRRAGDGDFVRVGARDPGRHLLCLDRHDVVRLDRRHPAISRQTAQATLGHLGAETAEHLLVDEPEPSTVVPRDVGSLIGRDVIGQRDDHGDVPLAGGFGRCRACRRRQQQHRERSCHRRARSS
jgi:hypothetical protein